MKNAVVILLGLSAALAACQNDTASPQQGADAPAAVTEPSLAPRSERPVIQSVLNLTDKQLLDASIIDSAGMEIGEVEAIVRSANGNLEKLLVEVDGASPQKFVHIAIGQVTPVQDKDEWDLRAPLTREDLMAMPSVERR